MTGASASLLRHVHNLVATHTIGQFTDQQLLERFADGREEAAFALLVRRHGPMVLGLCRRLLRHEQDAEDAFQAVFLILARKAGSIHQADVGGWLYRVAYHLAVRARGAAAKRKQRDKRGGVMSSTEPMMDANVYEVRSVVDEELQRLPDELRSAVVLCYLEGKTHDEAARLLGWSKRTLGRRLGRGRELLRTRLLARGLTPMAALTASLFAESAVSAAVPATLAAATVRTALTSKVAPAIAALAEAGSAILSVSKAKVATVVLLAMSALGGAAACGLALSSKQAVAAPAAKADDKPPTAPPKQAAKTVEIQGRVLAPDGKPKAGAKLLLLGKGDKLVDLGVSAPDGRFTVSLPKEPKEQHLVARADDAGIDFLDLDSWKRGKPVELRLVKDQVIRGRIVNTEGKPVAGARVAVDNLSVYPNNSLDSFLVTWKKRHFMSGLPGGVKHIWSGAGPLFNTTTDADGRFVFHGTGAERFVRLRVRGAGIADSEVWIVNRAGFDPKPYNQATLDNIPKGMESLSVRWLLYGPAPSAIVESEKPIRGIIKEADTGKGRPGVLVRLSRREGGALLNLAPEARTDARGHFEIHGGRKMKRYMLEVASDAKAGYMACQVWADDTAGYEPITANITVKKGVIITGKMIDGTTRKPIHGYAMADVLNDNPFVKDYPEFNSAAGFPMRDTDADGTFRLVILPGPVLLMGGPKDHASIFQYKAPAPDPKYPEYFNMEIPNFLAYYKPGGVRSPVQGNFCKVLQIKADAKVVEQDIVLERASVRTVQIQDADGKPLSGVWITGSSPQDFFPAVQCKDANCSAYQIEAGKPRLMVFFHKERKLAAALTLKSEEKSPVVVKLTPAGAIEGRLLDADGKPLAGVAIGLNYRDRAAQEIHNVVHQAKQIVTDANGAFTLDELVPELKFALSFRRGKRKFERETKPAEATIQVKAGACRDVGAIKLKLIPEKAGE